MANFLSALKSNRRAAIDRLRNLPPVRFLKKILRNPFALNALLRDRRTAGKFQHELAVGAIFKDEARYLDDWIAFHHGVGATHFYLYNNNSSDHFREALAPWIARGLVTLTDWPAEPGQRPAYRDCIRRHRLAAQWIAFLDIDEFLFSPKQRDIRPILRSYADLPALFVHWHLFGSSGHAQRPALPVPEAYTRRTTRPKELSGKSIVNPRLVRDVHQSHVFSFWLGETRDTNRAVVPKVPIPEKDGFAPAYDVLRIHHYWSRSLEDLAEKAIRGDAVYGGQRKLERLLAAEKRLNEQYDAAILLLWQEIKGERPKT